MLDSKIMTSARKRADGCEFAWKCALIRLLRSGRQRATVESPHVTKTFPPKVSSPLTAPECGVNLYVFMNQFLSYAGFIKWSWF